MNNVRSENVIIKNALILTENFVYEKLDIEFDEKILRIEKNIESDNFIDAKGLKLIPGLIDIHSHGANSVDACTDIVDDYRKLTEYYAKNGITSMLFTYATYPIEAIKSFFATANEYIDNTPQINTYAHGFHLEGVFINPDKKGAQAEEYIQKMDIECFKELYEASKGRLKLIIVAPEMDNAKEFIEYAKDYVQISLGHTNADYDIAMSAFDLGAKSITHAFNAMSPLHHRNPGVIAAALDKDAYVELICDGVHIHPAAQRLMYKACSSDKLVFVSDSMSATGMCDGEYILSGQKVMVENGAALLPDKTIAGSTTNLFECMVRSVKNGYKEENAIKAASMNPATMIGVNDVAGSIAIGKNADLLLIDDDFSINSVYIKGKQVK